MLAQNKAAALLPQTCLAVRIFRAILRSGFELVDDQLAPQKLCDKYKLTTLTADWSSGKLCHVSGPIQTASNGATVGKNQGRSVRATLGPCVEQGEEQLP